MGVVTIIGGLILLAVVFGPQMWVKRTLAKHSDERTDFPGTGGALAEHLIEHFNLDGVGVELTDKGDHYDPKDRMVRLSADHYDKASLTAVAVAAHEVGHAIQHHRGERGLKLRQSLVRIAMVSDRIATLFFWAAPVLFLIARTPAALFGMVAFGIGLLAIRVLVHAVTLPVEYDASFNKALPILKQGGYLQDDDLKAANSVLKAAAFTYVAGALMSLLDLARWLRFIR